ncbi:MAG: hypothetical protein JWQ71_3880 [Pedosphaera sp.]|nr:hypothetical protein [Pedosphaera sp.]
MDEMESMQPTQPMEHLVEGGVCVTTVKWLLKMTNVEFRMTNRNGRG